MRIAFILVAMSILAGCDLPSAQVSVDESTEAFVKRVIESSTGAGY